MIYPVTFTAPLGDCVNVNNKVLISQLDFTRKVLFSNSQLHLFGALVLGTDVTGGIDGPVKEHKVGILPRLISVETKLQNSISPTPALDHISPAAQFWGPPDTSILEPLQGFPVFPSGSI